MCLFSHTSSNCLSFCPEVTFSDTRPFCPKFPAFDALSDVAHLTLVCEKVTVSSHNLPLQDPRDHLPYSHRRLWIVPMSPSILFFPGKLQAWLCHACRAAAEANQYCGKLLCFFWLGSIYRFSARVSEFARNIALAVIAQQLGCDRFFLAHDNHVYQLLVERSY